MNKEGTRRGIAISASHLQCSSMLLWQLHPVTTISVICSFLKLSWEERLRIKAELKHPAHRYPLWFQTTQLKYKLFYSYFKICFWKLTSLRRSPAVSFEGTREPRISISPAEGLESSVSQRKLAPFLFSSWSALLF